MAHKHHHFAGDPCADSGFWSPSTSTANFCEEDYAVTRYIAEFINSLSSLAYAYFAIRLYRPQLAGPRGPLPAHPAAGESENREPTPKPETIDPPHRQHASFQTQHTDFPSIAALFTVGIASAIYHATLRQGSQFCDELSMLFLGGCLIQTLYSHGETPATANLVTAVTAMGTLAVSGFCVWSGNIFHHFMAFSTMLQLIFARTWVLINVQSRPQQDRKTMWGRFIKVVGWLVLGYIVWNIDLKMCHQLRELRASIGLPWAWLLELHGWWHILTALGAAKYIALVRDF